jgi:hypothetical protein
LAHDVIVCSVKTTLTTFTSFIKLMVSFGFKNLTTAIKVEDSIGL